jgi:flagellar motor protein MotB
VREGVLTDENIGWPSYVDFLATFLFILLLFVTWSLSLIAGAEREERIRTALKPIQRAFINKGFESVIEGHKLRIPLRDKVVFAINKSDLDDNARNHLRMAGSLIAAHPEIRRIVVMGYADRTPPKHDQFFNWHISVDRSQEVLKFLYLCKDCGYKPEEIRPKLVLRGDGDLDSRLLTGGEKASGVAGDRRVDIVLDLGDDEHL